jgi:excisionase family DNA binding protein
MLAFASRAVKEKAMNDQNRHIEVGDLLRIKQAAALATVQPSTIRAWLTQGKLPRMKIGRLTRILRSDLEALIHSGRVGVTTTKQLDIRENRHDSEATR